MRTTYNKHMPFVCVYVYTCMSRRIPWNPSSSLLYISAALSRKSGTKTNLKKAHRFFHYNTTCFHSQLTLHRNHSCLGRTRACMHACIHSEPNTHLGSCLIEDLHVHGSQLRAAAAPAEPGVLHGLVNVHSSPIADFISAASVAHDTFFGYWILRRLV